MGDGESVKGVIRTVGIFEVFAEAKTPLTLSELAERTGIPISSCHALVRTLEARGYLYLASRKRFYPTKRLGLVATSIGEGDQLLARIAQVLHQLTTTTGETTILGKMHGDSAIYLEVVEGTHTVRYAAQAGGTRPAHSSAIGKAVLSFLGDGELDAAISKLPLRAITERTIVDPAALAEDIRAGRARGYFFSRGETVSDVMGVAIARAIAGEPFGIGLAGPISRVESRLKSYLAALNVAGRDVEAIDVSLRGSR